MVMVEQMPAADIARKQKLRLWLRLLKTSRQIESEVRERFRTEFETTLPRFDVLAALERNRQGLKMSQLSRALKVSNGNVTVIIDRLVNDGMVKRVNIDGDRRASLVQLTQDGATFFAQMASRHEDWIDEIIGAIGENESLALTDALKNLVHEEG